MSRRLIVTPPKNEEPVSVPIPTGQAGRKRRDDPAPTLYRHFRGHYGAINSVYFHPSKTAIASGSDDTHIILWDFGKNMHKRAQRFEGHEKAVNDVAFLGEFGDLMLSCSDDKTIRLWVPTLRGEVRSIKGHSAAVRAIAPDPTDPARFLSCSNDKSLKLWDVKYSSKPNRKVYIHSHRFVSSWKIHKNSVNSVRFHPEGQTAITASDDRTVCIFDMRIPKAATGIRVDEAFGLPVYAEFSPTALDYFGLATENAVLMYDIRHAGRLVQAYKQIHTDKIVKFNFHPSGDYATCVSADRTIKILDLVEGRPVFTLFGSHSGLKAVHSSLDGSHIATGGKDKDILIWETDLRPYKVEDFEESEGLDANQSDKENLELHRGVGEEANADEEGEEDDALYVRHFEEELNENDGQLEGGFSDEEKDDLDLTLTDENVSSSLEMENISPFGSPRQPPSTLQGK